MHAGVQLVNDTAGKLSATMPRHVRPCTTMPVRELRQNAADLFRPTP